MGYGQGLDLVQSKLRRWCASIAEFEILPLAVGVALASFAAVPWAAVGLILIGVLWLVRWLARGRLTVRTPVDWPTMLLVLTVPISLFVTTQPGTSLAETASLLAGLALMYGLANWIRLEAHVSLLVLFCAGVGVLLAIVAPVTVGWFSKTKGTPLPAALLELLPSPIITNAIHPNQLAGILVMLLPFPLTLLLPGRLDDLPSVAGAVPAVLARLLDGKRFRRLWFSAALVLMLGTLALTVSRGGWMAAAAATSLILIRQRWFVRGAVPISVLAVGLVIWRSSPQSLLDALGHDGVIQGWDGRVEIWSRALYAIRDFPLTGAGIGTFEPIADALYPFFLLGPGSGLGHAHNLFLQVAVDLGLPGLVAYLAILIGAVWSAVEAARFYGREHNRALSEIARAGVASLVAMMVHGLVDAAAWTGTRGVIVPFAVIGLMVALANRARLANAGDGSGGSDMRR